VHGDFDAVIVGYPGHADVLAVRRALPDTPVVFNPLVSLEDTLINDRRRFAARSLPAHVLRALDRYAFAAADVVVADTDAHAELFVGLGAKRVEVCRVGADERVFHPPLEPNGPAHALFVGKLSPVHGIETVLAAARLTPEVSFRIVGEGQLEGELHRRPPNVDWVRWIDYASLGDSYRRATFALGIFAASAKAQRVIPNKAYHALACGTPLVTADTRAAGEVLVDGESALLVPAGDANALADTIRRVVEDAPLRQRLGEGGRAAFERHASDDVLARRWRDVVAGAT
jgi:glycosyltransferase involved in cell wall biosynthesis